MVSFKTTRIVAARMRMTVMVVEFLGSHCFIVRRTTSSQAWYVYLEMWQMYQ
jgi:hypothetical protein